MQKVVQKVIEPTIEGLKKDGIDYRGFIFFGLMNVDGEPMVIEYNVRMGDPESEVVIPRIKSDFLEVLASVGTDDFAGKKVEIAKEAATTVMLVSGGYPGSYEKGKEMLGLENVSGTVPFHAGTKSENGKILTNGGRVIALTSMHESWREALAKSYETAKLISFEGMYYRKDLGFDL